ncbi:MAG: RtcB family protein [Thermodesulfobacteriota bacterium]
MDTIKTINSDSRRNRIRVKPVHYETYGEELDEGSIQQMEKACSLPVSVKGAIMPDAHVGYGLPIGGVLATENSVIPYAVGVDIACRMKLTVLDHPVKTIEEDAERLISVLERETAFGIGAKFRGRSRRQHSVMDEDWSISQVTARVKDLAWSQLGTSGSGNHFVEYGVLTIEDKSLGIEEKEYLALLSHSGSRGAGNKIATHYSKMAAKIRDELPKEFSHLAWLDINSEEGKEYWDAMELMGRYAAASHELIHAGIAKSLGVDVLLDIENHHNFAWKEIHNGKEVIVHRKGATPAAKGILGIIPGSMATPGYVVRGKGEPASLNSASHGAGRHMSRKKAKETLSWEDAMKFLQDRGVNLISAGLDEVPMAYKDIEKVMAAQSTLVEVLACFRPRIVKMAPGRERPED